MTDAKEKITMPRQENRADCPEQIGKMDKYGQRRENGADFSEKADKHGDVRQPHLDFCAQTNEKIREQQQLENSEDFSEQAGKRESGTRQICQEQKHVPEDENKSHNSRSDFSEQTGKGDGQERQENGADFSEQTNKHKDIRRQPKNDFDCSKRKEGGKGKFFLRIVVYVAGLFLIAMGVAFSIGSGLGISPASSFPYILSLSLNLPLRAAIIAVYTALVGVQWAVLGKNFRFYNFFQILFAVVFGFFCDFSVKILGDFVLETYWGRLGMLAASITLIALGVLLYVEAKLLPLPVEGTALAFAKVSKRIGFPVFKIIMDAVLVILSIILSLVLLGKVEGIREGTLISAAAVGFVVKLLQKPLRPLINKICF